MNEDEIKKLVESREDLEAEIAELRKQLELKEHNARVDSQMAALKEKQDAHLTRLAGAAVQEERAARQYKQGHFDRANTYADLETTKSVALSMAEEIGREAYGGVA